MISENNMTGEYPTNRAVFFIVQIIFLLLALVMFYESYKILVLGIGPYSAKGYASVPGALVFSGFTIWFWVNQKAVSQNILKISEKGIGFGRGDGYQFFPWNDIKQISIRGNVGVLINIETRNGHTNIEPTSFNTLTYKIDSNELIEYLKKRGDLDNFPVTTGEEK